MNYAGSHELVRLFPLHQATTWGSLQEMEALAEQCMADYDEASWSGAVYRDGADVSVLGKDEG